MTTPVRNREAAVIEPQLARDTMTGATSTHKPAADLVAARSTLTGEHLAATSAPDPKPSSSLGYCSVLTQGNARSNRCTE